jgi:hypothetical protein
MPTTVFSDGITHNLKPMAAEAGLSGVLWKPEAFGIQTAAQLIPLLETGLAVLRSDPQRFRAFDSPNGWGRFEHLVNFVERYLNACRHHPEARVEASR